MQLVTLWSELPVLLRLVVLFGFGTVVGSAVNWAVYALRIEPLPNSPWSRHHPSDRDDGWLDRVPLWGWWRLRRKGKTLGYEFWIRPWLVEFLLGALWVGLYVWEVLCEGLTFDYIFPATADPHVLHLQCFVHLVLVSWMAAISLVDIDDQIIPDQLTVPGTLLGLLLAFAIPMSALPDVPRSYLAPNFDAAGEVRPLQLASPHDWPAVFAGPAGAGIALACWWSWIAALLPRTWYTRHGRCRALALCVARVRSLAVSRYLAALGAGGSLAIVAAWWQGGLRWQALLSALAGLVVGGGLIWGVRVIGKWALRREAMGFGDVTLLAMMGCYIGAPGSFFTFFIAPFLGAGLGLLRWITRRDNVIPFGPYLCLGGLVAIVCWAPLWERSWQVFYPGWLVPGALAVCAVLLAVILRLLRALRGG